MPKRSKSRVKKVRTAKKKSSATKRLKLRARAVKRPAKDLPMPASVKKADKAKTEEKVGG